jgi:hypothetical protein
VGDKSPSAQASGAPPAVSEPETTQPPGQPITGWEGLSAGSTEPTAAPDVVLDAGNVTAAAEQGVAGEHAAAVSGPPQHDRGDKSSRKERAVQPSAEPTSQRPVQEQTEAILVGAGGKLVVPREDFDEGLDGGTEIDLLGGLPKKVRRPDRREWIALSPTSELTAHSRAPYCARSSRSRSTAHSRAP